MPQKIDLVGVTKGKLTVISEDRKYIICLCSCGNKTRVLRSNFFRGHSLSCGCLKYKSGILGVKVPKKIRTRKVYTKYPPKLCNRYRSIITRCYDRLYREYHLYGGRGIKVEEPFLNGDGIRNGLECFADWSLANGYEDDKVIDRIDNNGNYSPSNCRWTDTVTNANNKRNNRFVEIDGVTKTISQWCRHFKLSKNTFDHRLGRGWDIVKALVTPPIDANLPRRFITIDGQTKSMQEWLTIYGIKELTFLKRLRDGMTEEEALRIPVKTPSESASVKHRFYTINGVTKSQAEWLEHFGICYWTFYRRIKNGWSVEKALTEPIRNSNKELR